MQSFASSGKNQPRTIEEMAPKKLTIVTNLESVLMHERPRESSFDHQIVYDVEVGNPTHCFHYKLVGISPGTTRFPRE